MLDSRFIYVNQSFAPSPDQEVGTLYECFGSDGKLVLLSSLITPPFAFILLHMHSPPKVDQTDSSKSPFCVELLDVFFQTNV
ncbi:hypothetical protein EK904_004725 [Melospiza melodia maxima]|nr:hypothetical protein EK904_004725 [Melospiza melodia maxima]